VQRIGGSRSWPKRSFLDLRAIRSKIGPQMATVIAYGTNKQAYFDLFLASCDRHAPFRRSCSAGAKTWQVDRFWQQDHRTVAQLVRARRKSVCCAITNPAKETSSATCVDPLLQCVDVPGLHARPTIPADRIGQAFRTRCASLETLIVDLPRTRLKSIGFAQSHERSS
jgi:hypothetical protein